MKYVLFDLDGTLTDPKIGITTAVAYSLESFGIKVENLDDLCPFIGPPLVDSFMKFYGFSEEKAEKAVEKYREYYSVTGLFENFEYEGIANLLKNLQNQGKTLLVATSKPKVFAEKILDYFNLSQYFTYIGGCGLDGSLHTKSEVILHVLEQVNVPNLDEAIMVGDREFDIIGAKKVGIKSIGVLYGYGNMEEFVENGADFIVSSVQELEELLTIDNLGSTI